MTPARVRELLGTVAEGTRVVVRTLDGVVAGRLVGVTEAHVRVALRTGEARIALDGIERIEVMHDPVEGKWRGRFSSAKHDEGDADK
jgi:hypothetical protein